MMQTNRDAWARTLCALGPPDGSLPLHALPRGFHPRGDVLGVPAGEAGEILRLLAEARRQRGEIGVGRRTARGAAPGVAQHVAALEVLAVARLHEHEVFGEMGGVIAY